MEEPPLKKIKNEPVQDVIEDIIDKLKESTNNIKAVLSNDLCDPIPTEKVYIGHVKDIKSLSEAITILNEKMPLKTLQHLKRVRRKEIVLCPTSFLSDICIREYMKNELPELYDSFEYFKVIEVPAVPPKLKKQYEEVSKMWSVNFHPNHYLEKITGDRFFNAFELKEHNVYMRMAFEAANMYVTDHKDPAIDINSINATVIVDPKNRTVVAVSFDNRQEHPIQHSAMLAIDNVAKTQNGGAWNTENITATDRKLSGIDKQLKKYLKKKFDKVKFGAMPFKVKDDSSEVSDGPYLCTGYYVYMIREPCLMCSMALVHSRVKRLFFYFDNPDNGALKSKAKLQYVSSLNHRFEVFSGFS